MIADRPRTVSWSEKTFKLVWLTWFMGPTVTWEEHILYVYLFLRDLYFSAESSALIHEYANMCPNNELQ